MLKKWFALMNKLFGEHLPFRERIFNISISMGIAAMEIAIIMAIFLGGKSVLIVVLSVIFLIISVALWVSINYHKMEQVACLVAVIINLIFFPVSFFVNGGIESGTTVWLVLGIVFNFILLTGVRLFIFMTLTVVEFIAAYYLAYYRPEFVIPLGSRSFVFISSALSVITVGLVIGLIISFQSKIFEKQKLLADKQRMEIEQISQSRSAFFANMSHEIRTPINTIIGLNEMTLRENISDEIAENAINIQNASKMLLALINDILDLSKIESGRMEIVPTQYETGAMFSDLVNIVWIRAHEKNLEFKIDIAKDIPSMLYGDEIRIKQVLVNILTNAVKYTKTGSVTLTAKSEKIDANLVRLKISVADTGMGIRKENMEDLFTSFKRVDQERNSNIEGTGLGLSISKQLLELMGGKITVDSIYTKGSVFSIILEQKIIDEKPIGSMDFMIKRKLLNREKYKQSFEAPDARILVVDDNEMNLMVACKLLRSTKVQIDTAGSGKECLEKTKLKSYNVIFMDHKMPEMDGVETLECVRKQHNGLCKNVPVIALTANAISGADSIYKEYGFNGYLAKPINGAMFEATLLKFLPDDLVEYSVAELNTDMADSTIKVVSGKAKRSVKITTDCVCDLPQDLLDKFDIKTMYYYIATSHGHFADIKEMSSDNLLEYLAMEGNKVHTEHAPVKEYERFFADALDEAEQVIHISMAANASNGYETAKSAAEGFDNVKVVDSGHLSSGMGIMVLAAAKAAKEGSSAEEIRAYLKQLKHFVSSSFIVPTPAALYHNGKINKTVKTICEILDLHPVLTLHKSSIKCFGMEVGTVKKAYRKYIKHQLRNKKKIDNRILFITYAGCTLKQQEEFVEEVKKYMDFENIILQKASATISSNCGLGAFGLLFVKKS